MHTREQLRSELENGAEADDDYTELPEEPAREKRQRHQLHLAATMAPQCERLAPSLSKPSQRRLSHQNTAALTNRSAAEPCPLKPGCPPLVSSVSRHAVVPIAVARVH